MDVVDKGQLIQWSTKTTEHFLEIYRKYRCLWDFEAPGYTVKLVREEAFRNVLTELAMPIDVKNLKRKIHSIRNAYTNELRKMERSKQTATRPEHVYRPRTPWFYQADKFLRKIVDARKDIHAAHHENLAATRNVTASELELKNKSAIQQLDSPEDEFDATGYLSGASVCTNDSNNSRIRTALQYDSTVSNDLSDSYPSTSESRLQRVVAPTTMTMHGPSTNAETQCKQEPPDSPNEDDPFQDESAEMITFQNEEEDELDAFVRSILLQMRRLPEEYNIELMAEIQRLVSDKRMKYLRSCT